MLEPSQAMRSRRLSHVSKEKGGKRLGGRARVVRWFAVSGNKRTLSTRRRQTSVDCKGLEH